jgi:hypothetical protein
MEKQDFYTNLEKLFENPSSASEGKSFTLRKNKQNEWNLIEDEIQRQYNDDGVIIPNHQPIEHSPEAQKQIKLFLQSLKTDSHDESIYRFDIHAPVFDSLIYNIVQQFSGTPKQVLNIYQKCYAHNPQSYFHFLKASYLNKEMFQTLFEYGYVYHKITNPNVISDGKLRKIFESIQKSLFSEDELKEMMFKHFQASEGVENLKNTDILKFINQTLPQADNQRMLFAEKILSLNQYQPDKFMNDEEHHMSYFNLSLTEMMGQYRFSLVEDIDKLMDVLQDKLQLHATSFGLDSIASKWIKKGNTQYLRVFVESIDANPVNVEQIRTIHYQVFDAHTQWNLIENSHILNDIILYHVFSDRFENNGNDENKTIIESSGKMKI